VRKGEKILIGAIWLVVSQGIDNFDFIARKLSIKILLNFCQSSGIVNMP
jgi:hypothetical protein